MRNELIKGKAIKAVWLYMNGSTPFGISGIGKFTILGNDASEVTLRAMWDYIRYFNIPLDSHFMGNISSSASQYFRISV